MDRVVSVEWTYIELHNIWVPRIELHDNIQHHSITEFYEWYAPLVGKRKHGIGKQ